jgi:hypothetical protein
MFFFWRIREHDGKVILCKRDKDLLVWTQILILRRQNGTINKKNGYCD